MYARVVLGATKSVPFREVSSIQGCPYRGVPLYNTPLSHITYYTCAVTHSAFTNSLTYVIIQSVHSHTHTHSHAHTHTHTLNAAAVGESRAKAVLPSTNSSATEPPTNVYDHCREITHTHAYTYCIYSHVCLSVCLSVHLSIPSLSHTHTHFYCLYIIKSPG